MDRNSFQFGCPSCGAVLQAGLRQVLTSVQCGECYDVFDVQLPGRRARARAPLGCPGRLQRPPNPRHRPNPAVTPHLSLLTPTPTDAWKIRPSDR